MLGVRQAKLELRRLSDEGIRTTAMRQRVERVPADVTPRNRPSVDPRAVPSPNSIGVPAPHNSARCPIEAVHAGVYDQQVAESSEREGTVLQAPCPLGFDVLLRRQPIRAS